MTITLDNETEMLDICECGHFRWQHYTASGWCNPCQVRGTDRRVVRSLCEHFSQDKSGDGLSFRLEPNTHGSQVIAARIEDVTAHCRTLDAQPERPDVIALRKATENGDEVDRATTTMEIRQRVADTKKGLPDADESAE